MSNPSPKTNKKPSSRAKDDFATRAEAKPPGLISEFREFLLHHKKWWLIPILIALGLVSVLVLLSSSAIAPFIYPFF